MSDLESGLPSHMNSRFAPMYGKIQAAYPLTRAMVSVNANPARKLFASHIYVDLFHRYGGMEDSNAWKYREDLRMRMATNYAPEDEPYFYEAINIPEMMFGLGFIGGAETDQLEKDTADMFIHRAKDFTKVAYTQSESHGMQDRQTVTTIGRLAKKIKDDLTDAQVRELSETYNGSASVDVKFSEDENDFIRAINEGPSESCMQGLEFNGHIHPAAVYASGDILVAWMEKDDRITARTLINKNTKAFSRVYGDESRLKPELQRRGYSQEVGALVGCKLRKISNNYGDGYIMAYVDAGIGSGGGSLHVKEYTNHWMLTEGGGLDTYVGYDRAGVTDEPEDEYDSSCDRCGDGIYEGDQCWSEYHQETFGTCCVGRYEDAVVSITQRGTRNRDWVRDNECTYIECLNEHVLDNNLGEILNALDVVELYNGDYAKLDDAVETCDGDWVPREDATAVGTDRYGDTVWVLTDEISSHASEYYTDADGNFFHEDSSEIEAWKDSEGDEDYDPEEYTPYEKPTVEPEVQAEPEVQPQLAPIVPEPDWRNAYSDAQSAGLKFQICTEGLNDWETLCPLMFGTSQHRYRIDPTQDFPTDCVGIFTQMQHAGVKFYTWDIHTGTWDTHEYERIFNLPFGYYCLAAAEAPEVQPQLEAA